METWRQHSLVKKARYRVMEAFSSSTDMFALGMIVTFIEATYSPYDCMTGFHFQAESGEMMAFDVPDSQEINRWTSKLEILKQD